LEKYPKKPWGCGSCPRETPTQKLVECWGRGKKKLEHAPQIKGKRDHWASDAKRPKKEKKKKKGVFRKRHNSDEKSGKKQKKGRKIEPCGWAALVVEGGPEVAEGRG